MRFAIAAATLAGVAAAQNATAPAVYVTDVVTAYTTYCPEATEITHAGLTYTVSSATTLVITNCPGGCTITRPAAYSSTPITPVPTTPAAPIGTAPAPVPVAPVPSAVVPYPSSNVTAVAPYSSGAATPTGSSSTSTPSPYTGAAGKAYYSAGAGFLALFGLVAAL
ncbi:hypothetical protein LTR53_014472 [Teratosphaeriaceae sp. CCFEE 6253]|nr:hypothetical protein LTR53_014472 [Teratosphaeriaceae sp. CCFEE 6253]